MNGTTRPVQPAGGKWVTVAGAGIGLIAAGVILWFAVAAGSPHGLNVHAAGIVLMLAGALGLLLALLIRGPLTPARHHRDSRRSYDGERPVLVRAEKRLYQDPGRQPLADERHACQGKPPL